MMDSTRGAQKFMAGGSVGISGGLQGALGGNLGEGLGDFSFWVALGLKVFLCWSSEFESLKYHVRLANLRFFSNLDSNSNSDSDGNAM